MADDANATLPQYPAEPSLPAPNKRRRLDTDGRDLKRVAEIVMVLAAMGQMRGGREPSPAEKSLAAEARGKLVAMCESLRPNDLFTSEAARIIAGDLGFSHQMGNRPGRKVSIAEKVALTKKKMAESKEFMVQSTPYKVTYMQGQHQGPQRAFGEKSNPMQQSSASFQTVLPAGHSAALVSNTAWKQMPFGEAQQSVGQMRPPVGSVGKDSPSSSMSVRAVAAHVRSDVQPSGSSYPFQVSATSSGNQLPEKIVSASSVVSTSTTVTTPAKSTQVIKSVVQTPMKVESSHADNLSQTFPLATENHNIRTPPLQATQGKVSGAGHLSQSANVLPSCVVKSIEIAKSVQKILQLKNIDLTGWNPPSVDYMSHPLNCQICKISITDLESLLVCDACEKGIHLRCLKSLNQKALTNLEWHCPKCLLASNGKTLPPKYGKVTRSIGTSKPPSNPGGSHVSSEKRPEIPDPKVSHQKATTSVKTRSSLHTDTPNTNTSSGEQTTYAPMVNSNDNHGRNISSNSIGVEMGNLLHEESCTDQTNEKGSSICDSSNTTSNIEEKYSGQCRTSVRLFPCSMKGSTSEFTLDPKTESVPSHGELPTTGVNICDQPETAAVNQTGDDTGLPLNSMSLSNLDHENVNNTEKEFGNTSRLEDMYEQKVANNIRKENCVNSSSLAISNHDTVNWTDREVGNVSALEELSQQKVSNDMREDICDDTPIISTLRDGGDGAKDCKLPPLPDLYNVEWIGEAIERVDNKLYYQSCCINDVIYNLQDYVLLPSQVLKFSPSKLQILWEDIEDGSKWAIVNRCYFPTDISEAVAKPCTPINNEVYESNDSNTVEAGRIHGPSIVVSPMKFNEESEMQAYLAERNNATHPMFFCRWFYDKTNGLFQPKASS